MAKKYKYRIHPAIGVARLGKSVDATRDWFDGPEELNEDFVPPVFPGFPGVESRYRDPAGALRRQRAVFRIFEYEFPNEKAAKMRVPVPSRIREVTMTEAKITWTVEVANRKCLSDTSAGVPLAPPAQSLDTKSAPRVDLAAPYRRETGAPAVDVLLAQIATDSDGRLLVLSGLGVSASPGGAPAPLINFKENPGWYDDVADGPITATVDFTGMPNPPDGVVGVQTDVDAAWVVTGAPRFAPALEPIISLYDVAFAVAVAGKAFRFPSRLSKPSFRQDIYPILHKAAMAHWSVPVLQGIYAFGIHQFEEPSFGDATFRAAGKARFALLQDSDATPGSAPLAARQKVFMRLKNPSSTGPSNSENMPRMARALPVPTDNVQSLNKLHYKMMAHWAAGNFHADWKAPVPPLTRPEELDQVHMKSMVGGAFVPGIEVSDLVRSHVVWRAPFRLDDTLLPAGYITQGLAVPWQADFSACKTENNQEWWPSHRLMKVLPGDATDYSGFVVWAPYPGFKGMVDNWHKLGFLTPKTIPTGKLYVLSEPSTPSPP